ncbi:MAG: autotransporter domain-containing protein [Rhodothalassiaceae bacterium]
MRSCSFRCLLGAVSTLALSTAATAQTALVTLTEDLTEQQVSATLDEGSAADLTLSSTASIAVTGDTSFLAGTEGAAFVLNSSNTLNNTGIISSTASPGATAVLVETGADGVMAEIINEGVLVATGAVAPVVGPNFGILLRGPGGFIGDITNGDSGVINVVGSGGSVGVDIDTSLMGSLINTGEIVLSGSGGVGIRVNAPVSGTVSTGTLQVTAEDGAATGILVTDQGSAAGLVVQESSFVASQAAEGTGARAVGLQIDGLLTPEPGAPAVSFDAPLTVIAEGPDSEAIALLDTAGGVEGVSIANGSAVAAQGESGATAFDLRANSSGVSIVNEGVITGAVVTGAGDDTVSLSGGVLNGLVDLGMGVGQVTLADADISGVTQRSSLTGGLIGGGPIDLTVQNSDVFLTDPAGAAVRSASFDADSGLGITLLPDGAAVSSLVAEQGVSLADGTQISVIAANFPDQDQDFVLIEAGELDLGGFDTAQVDVNLSAVLFDTAISFVDAERDSLLLSVARVPTAELGLNSVQAAVLDNIIGQFEANSTLGAALATIPDQAALQGALSQLSPQASGSARFAAATMQSLSFGAVNQRFETLRSLKRFEESSRSRAPDRRRGSVYRERVYTVGLDTRDLTIWGQEVTHFFTRDERPDAPGFDGFVLNFLGGVDFPLFGLDAVGVTAGYGFTENTDEGLEDGNLFVRSIQVGGYASHSIGNFYIDLSGSVSFNEYENDRVIVINEAVADAVALSGSAGAEWNGIQFGGQAQAGYRIDLGRFGLNLAGQANYVRVDEDAYTESGTEGLIFEVEDRLTESLRVGGRVSLDALFAFRRELTIKPEIRGAISQELLDDPVRTDVRFVGAAQSFSLAAAVPDTTSFLGGVGVAIGFGLGIVSLDYEFEYADDFRSHGAGITFRFAF